MSTAVEAVGRALESLEHSAAAVKQLQAAPVPLWPWQRAGSEAAAFRAEAVTQARAAVRELQSLVHSGSREPELAQLRAAIDALDAAPLRWNPGSPRGAASVSATLERQLAKVRLHGARDEQFIEAAPGMRAWNDEAALRTWLESLARPRSAGSSLLHRQHALALDRFVEESPALRRIAPAVPTNFGSDDYPRQLARMLTDPHSDRTPRVARRVIAHILDGTFASEQARTAALQRAAERADLASMDDAIELAALAGPEHRNAGWFSSLTSGNEDVPYHLRINAVRDFTRALGIKSDPLADIGRQAQVLGEFAIVPGNNQRDWLREADRLLRTPAALEHLGATVRSNARDAVKRAQQTRETDLVHVAWGVGHDLDMDFAELERVRSVLQRLAAVADAPNIAERVRAAERRLAMYPEFATRESTQYVLDDTRRLLSDPAFADAVAPMRPKLDALLERVERAMDRRFLDGTPPDYADVGRIRAIVTFGERMNAKAAAPARSADALGW